MAEYPVFMEKTQVGTASMSRKGLYWNIQCRCRLSGKRLFRMELSGSRGNVDLGILLPEDGGYGLKKSIAVKQIGDEPYFFRVKEKGKSEGKFIPLHPDEPFDDLHRLIHARFEICNGVAGLRIV